MGMVHLLPEVALKECSRCREAKLVTEFYRDKRTPTGLKSQCKSCHIEGNIRTRDEDRKRECNAIHMALARIANPEKFRARERAASRRRVVDERVLARRAVHAALRSGHLIRPMSCERCGCTRKMTAHHPDYSRPLVVMWLCHPCHSKEHRHA